MPDARQFLCRSHGKGAPPGAFGECVECAKHVWCAPGAIAGAVGELDDDTGRDKRVDVSAGVAGGDPEFALKREGVEDRLPDKEIRDAVNGRVAARGDL